MIKLTKEFYRESALTVARQLIGKTLVRICNGREMRGIISETEAYMGITDKACHSYGGRRTKRTETMYMDGGHAYVYLIYGMYNCMNITASTEDVPEAVLIRAVYPIVGESYFVENYNNLGKRRKVNVTSEAVSPKKLYSLADGPGKLCISMGIDRSHDRYDMTSDDFYVCDEGYTPRNIICSERIGVAYAEEDAKKPWRFTAETESGVPVFIKL